MTPEQEARQKIDARLEQAGWVIQDYKKKNPRASLGVAIREYPTSTGPVDYALFIDGAPVGVIEAKQDNYGEKMSSFEGQSGRYANSTFKHVPPGHKIRFVYEATGKLIHFTDLKDINYRSRRVFSFYRPERLKYLLDQDDTIRNHLKHFPDFDATGFRDCQTKAIKNLERSFAENHPKALIQMATGAGKTFTAITAAYRLLKFGKMRRILFLVDTKALGEQAEREFKAYKPNDSNLIFQEIYRVCRLNSSHIPEDTHVYISTIQRMYSILKGEEMDESLEEESLFEQKNAERQPQKVVVYNEKCPPEFFDCIFVDECHRSIYNVWSQVLEYFDAFLVGLTATPSKRTIGFFDENLVSEYTRKQAIADGVNVGEDVFIIDTEITVNGAHIPKQQIEHRNRLTREKLWKMMDDDVNYNASNMDRDVVNPSQIRTVIRSFRDYLPTIFPMRKEVPKTLIFAKTDSHAEDIVQAVRNEFNEGDEFCKKITCRADRPEVSLNSFRNDFNPRIAVTVDMIATGIDVKPIECLLFMRDVRSMGYFEQMTGRGTRVLSDDDLQKVTPSAKCKDHFIILDAVGVTRSPKRPTVPLERKPTVSLKDLMDDVVGGHRDEDTLISLANRLIRLNIKLKQKQRDKFEDKVGVSLQTLAQRLLDSYDWDVISEKAGIQLPDDDVEPTEEEKQLLEEAQKPLIDLAVKPFFDPEVRDYIEEVRRSLEQIIDSENLDRVIYAGFKTDQKMDADRVIKTFHEFIEENRDEILALRIIYDQRYKDRPMVFEQLQELYAKLKQRHISLERLWECYTIKKPEKVKRGVMAQLADLVSLIRFEMGLADSLAPFADRVNYNFMQWTLRRNAGNVHFTKEQMEWLQLIRDHIATSLSIEKADLDYSPFDSKGGLSRFYDLFGDGYEVILKEMNLVLVA